MTSAAITMTAPEAASPVQMYRATYSPDDNKLRLYAVSRLDPETYKKVHDAGFRWAPKQALFVAPAWTPGREDVLLSLAGEIEDEDSTLAERQEARAERFTGYSGNTPVSFPPQGSVAVPPPTAFYPGNGVTPPPQVTYQSVPVPNRIQRKVFDGAESQPDPAGCAGRNAGGAYFLPGQQLVAVPAGKNAGGRRRATEGDRENSRTPRLRR